jgi:hypothetical protein
LEQQQSQLQLQPQRNPTSLFKTAADFATYKVKVTNTGLVYAADEVVLAFFKPKAATIPSLLQSGTPVVIKQLFGFEKVHLAPGASVSGRICYRHTCVPFACNPFGLQADCCMQTFIIWMTSSLAVVKAIPDLALHQNRKPAGLRLLGNL